MDAKYYDGTKLLSLKDINGNEPEIYICTSNRTAGKTTYFNRLFVNKFKQNKGEFMLLYRFDYELDDIPEKFFKDIKDLFFQKDEFTAKKRCKGVYVELFLNGKTCGYATSLNKADMIKKYSHVFKNVERIGMDEFQSETNHYCNDECKKLMSIHTSVARGQGKQVRRVPVFLIGNPVSIINPYYTQLKISSRLEKKTKFLKGDGWVLEQGYNETASRSQKESAFMRAFSSDSYAEYSAQGKYLNDNESFIEKPVGKSRYLGTFKYQNKCYGIREYEELGIIYCDDKPDMTYPLKISVTTEDHEINYVMLRSNDLFLLNMRYFFEHGCFRFKDLKCKEVVLSALSY